jgi:hypothetical protein
VIIVVSAGPKMLKIPEGALTFGVSIFGIR